MPDSALTDPVLLVASSTAPGGEGAASLLPRALLFFLWSILILLVALLASGLLWRRHLNRSPRLPETVQERIEAFLLDVIKNNSHNRRERLTLPRSVWTRAAKEVSGLDRLRWIDRTRALNSLKSKGHIVLRGAASLNFSPADVVQDVLVRFFAFPAFQVELTDATWHLLFERNQSGAVIIGTMYWSESMTYIEGSDFRGAAFGGRDAQATTSKSFNTNSDNKNSFNTEGSAKAALDDVIAQLRTDGKRLEDPQFRSEVEALADKLEDEASKESSDSDLIDGVIGRAERYVNRAGGLMAATSAALESWFKIRGQV